jgi:glutaminyl-peptide cyclotransferase
LLQFIISQLTKLNYAIELDQFEALLPGDHDRCNMTNIIATLDPKAPRRIVLACHYDSKFDVAGEFIGMSDSAVPCAMMIDLAQALHPYLSDREFNPNVTLQLMFLDGEEAVEKWSATDSLYGARNLALKLYQSKNRFASENSSLTELNSIDVMVLLDLIGTKDTQFRAFYYTAKVQFERLSQIEQNLVEKKSVRNWGRTVPYFDKTPLAGSVWVDDDYRPFIQKGVKIVHLISYPFPTVWHKNTDDLSSLHYETVEDLLKILRIYLCEYLGCKV